VTADRVQLAQLLQNLLANAMKFTPPERRPEIAVRGEADGDMVRISIADRGIGVDPGRADALFSMFARGVGDDRYEGTGIGLAVCARIVGAHGGRLWVDPAPAAGASSASPCRGRRGAERLADPQRQGVDQAAVGLGDEAGGPELEDHGLDLGGVLAGQDDDLGGGQRRDELRERREPGHRGHDEVEQDGVRPGVGGLLQARAPVAALAHDLHVVLDGEERPHERPEAPVVVADEDPRALHPGTVPGPRAAAARTVPAGRAVPGRRAAPCPLPPHLPPH
jgi:hypothetical protein